MKKYIILAAVCAAMLAGTYVLPSAVSAGVPAAETVSPSEVLYSESILGSGTLSCADQGSITCSLPLVISSFSVSEGDTVEAGDVIAEVDREATKAFITSLSAASLSSLSAVGLSADSISAATAFIPERITSDRTGRVIFTAGNGAAIEAGGDIAAVAATDSLIITAAVSEADISKIYVGQAVEFECTAYPDETFSGTVAKISCAARCQYSGTALETVIDVIITPDKADERLKSGLTADVRFKLTEAKKICVVPYEAVGQDDEGEYVYVYEDGKAVKRKIFTGAEFSDGTEVIKGVTLSDRVILDPEAVSLSPYVRIDE